MLDFISVRVLVTASQLLAASVAAALQLIEWLNMILSIIWAISTPIGCRVNVRAR